MKTHLSPESIFATFLGAHDRGEDPDIEQYCERHRQHAPALRELHEDWLDFTSGLATTRAEEESSSSWEWFLSRIRELGPVWQRYDAPEQIDRGGMGVVSRVTDRVVGRSVAMKVMIGDGVPDADRRAAPVGDQMLGRFIEEAQVTGRLDHPNIVPVHDVGLDSDGRMFFTMKLVKGENLRGVLEKCRDREEGWSETRVVSEVVQRVCDAMAFAHSKGVLHRDLKPANIMIGRFGEVYVMDWGLARVLGEPDQRDIRIRAPSAEHSGPLHTDRADLVARDSSSNLRTMDGAVLGTPAYMSPEQAKGQLDEMDFSSDVYSIGAILYHLIAGHPPYFDVAPGANAHAVWRLACEGEPTPLAQLDTTATPAELIAICDKAMAPRRADRYRDMVELSEDLSSFLENRVVRAHRTGARAELSKWVARNRRFAIAAAAAILVLLVSAIAFGVQQKGHNQSLVKKNKVIREEKEKVESLSDRRILEALRAEADGLWPLRAFMAEPMASWLVRARELAERLPNHERNLELLRRMAREPTPERRERDRRSHPRFAEYQRLEAEIARLEFWLSKAEDLDRREELAAALSRATSERDAVAAALTERRTWDLGDETRTWNCEQLGSLVEELRGFADPEAGLIREIEDRRRLALEMSARSIDTNAQRWDEAIESIRRGDTNPLYRGLDLAPQVGLIPLRPDPHSGLWEFLQCATGRAPRIDPSRNAYVPPPDMGLVLVLLPGGTFRMGATPAGDDGSPVGPHVDPGVSHNADPVHEVTLDPFFISKFEMTQGQWAALGGGWPSTYGPEATGSHEASAMLPVERVSWSNCRSLLARVELDLPTEAQWEYAARAGTSTRWWTGDEPSEIRIAGNIADQSLKEETNKPWQFADWDDGNAVVALVTEYAPNPFGLHQTIGNVFEWCLDGMTETGPTEGTFDYSLPTAAGTGLRLWVPFEKRVVRGGSHQFAYEFSSSAARSGRLPEHLANTLGVRPARKIERPGQR